MMMLIITGVGFLIHLYSTSYMADDDGYARFFAYLNLFIFAMLVLDPRRQSPASLRRVGGRGPLLLPAHRLLVREGIPMPRRGRKPSSRTGSAISACSVRCFCWRTTPARSTGTASRMGRPIGSPGRTLTRFHMAAGRRALPGGCSTFCSPPMPHDQRGDRR